MAEKESGMRMLTKAATALAIIPLLTDIDSLKGEKNPEEAFAATDKVIENFLANLESAGFILVPIKGRDEILNGAYGTVDQLKRDLGLAYSEPAPFHD